MTDDAFIQTILAEPNDDALRLIYADWLEERGDLRAAFLRAEVSLVRAASADPNWGELHAQLRDTVAGIDPRWLASISRVPIENCGLLPSDSIGPREFDRIQLGMTVAEIEAIMKRPPENDESLVEKRNWRPVDLVAEKGPPDFDHAGNGSLAWCGERYWIHVWFDEEGKMRAAFLLEGGFTGPPNLLDRIRFWLGLSTSPRRSALVPIHRKEETNKETGTIFRKT